jgi:hypothetical protein
MLSVDGKNFAYRLCRKVTFLRRCDSLTGPPVNSDTKRHTWPLGGAPLTACFGAEQRHPHSGIHASTSSFNLPSIAQCGGRLWYIRRPIV